MENLHEVVDCIEVGISTYCTVAEDFRLEFLPDNETDALVVAGMVARDAIDTAYLIGTEFEVSVAFVVIDHCSTAFSEVVSVFVQLEGH